MFRILVAFSAFCCASINNLSSPAKSPQLPPVDPATERAAAKLAGREEDMLYYVFRKYIGRGGEVSAWDVR